MQLLQSPEFLLVIDEVHKIDNWSEAVKKEWDYDSFNDIPLKVVLLGSSRLLLKDGLTETLAGRFEVDFIIEYNRQCIAIEVKSGRRTNNQGLALFQKQFQPKWAFVVGSGGLPLEDFLTGDMERLSVRTLK